MAGLNVPMNRSTGRRIGDAALSAPRLVMSWEDWLTFAVALFAFLSIAVSIQDARWVPHMPPLVPTMLGGLLIGMFAARTRAKAVFIHPVALVLGFMVMVLVVQTYADGANIGERLTDFRVRMREWFEVVRAGDISNDNLPFITLVHSLTILCAYLASWSIFRWRNPWFAVIPGGMVLLANISFLRGQPSGAFIVFLFGAIILIARLHLQKSQQRWRRQGVDYPEFISLPSIQLTVLATAGLIIGAWFLPLGGQAGMFKSMVDTLTAPATSQSDTLVRLFHNIDSHKGASLHSFGDILPIQGSPKLGNKEVFEVNSPEPGLVRGQSYEYYTGNGWKTSDRQDTRVPAKDYAITKEGAGYLKRNVSTLQVKVLDSESTILTPGTPIGSNLPTTVQTPKDFTGDIERMISRKGLGNGDIYNSIGSQSTATADDLLRAGADYPSWVTDRYLQLPKELPERVRTESQRVVANAGQTPYQQAEAIEAYLRTFPFSLDVTSPPPGRDMVDFFLFDLKAGYFDYQASAMTVMLRTLGIPARVAVGYVLDPANAQETRYTVHKDDAYAWVEVFFPEYGWINFNPTRDRPQGGAGGFGGGGGTGIIGDVDLSQLFPDDFQNPQPGLTDSGPQKALQQDPVVHSSPPWTLIWALAGVLVVLAVSGLGARWAWNRGMAGLEGRAQLWAKTQRLAGWVRLGPKSTETPREWSGRVGNAVRHEEDASKLADAYEEARYGRPDLQRIDDADTEGAYRNLRNTLFGRLLKRKQRNDRR